jgi:hypothetical protein
MSTRIYDYATFSNRCIVGWDRKENTSQGNGDSETSKHYSVIGLCERNNWNERAWWTGMLSWKQDVKGYYTSNRRSYQEFALEASRYMCSIDKAGARAEYVRVE